MDSDGDENRPYPAPNTEFLKGEHSQPHVIAFDMQALIRETDVPLNVLYTDENMQFAIEMVQPLGRVPREIHPTQSQFIRVESGHARIDIFYPENVTVMYKSIYLSAANDTAATTATTTDEDAADTTSVQDTIIIHAGVYHEVTNLSTLQPLKFYTIYSPHVH